MQNNIEDQPVIKIDDAQSIVDEITKQLSRKFSFFITTVVVVLVITTLTLLIMVSTLVVDSFHINSVIYKEYANKQDVVEQLKQMNDMMLEQRI